jgi:hypothetical protein
MAATFQNNGLNPLNQVILNKATGAPWVMHLFTNVITPAVTDTVGSYTECVLSGYASTSLTGSSWTGSATAGTDTETYPSITTTFASYAGGTTIYGYYITITVSSTTYLLCSQNFASGYAVPSGGGSLVINLTETLT